MLIASQNIITKLVELRALYDNKYLLDILLYAFYFLDLVLFSLR